jgi:uncharacterized membrane protein YcfT
MTATTTPADIRIDWVDYAKGICIILVVMMHSTLGVAAAMGEPNWLNGFIAWAAPFRMPDFFLISGLFLASRIDRPWRAYADTKIMHFAYFYLLWMTIQTALKGWSGPDGVWGLPHYWLTALVEPLGTLWFIYVLILFFVTAKLVRHVPVWIVCRSRPRWSWPPSTPAGSPLTSLPAASSTSTPATWPRAGSCPLPSGVSRVDAPSLLAFLATWAVVNLWAVQSGLAFAPVLSMAFGYAGCAAVITLAQLMTRTRVFEAVRYCGANTLPVYLAFFLFMAATRVVLLKTGIITDGGVISLIVTAAGVIGPLVLHWIALRTPARFLFVRPAFARLTGRGDQPAAGSLSAGRPKPV